MENDEQQILKLFEDGDRALIAADVAELSRIFADDYIQYDESGESRTKQNVIKNLETRHNPLPIDSVHGPPDSRAERRVGHRPRLGRRRC